jgi:hypothetical protein
LGWLVKTVGLARLASFFLLLVQKKEAKENDTLRLGLRLPYITPPRRVTTHTP